MAGEALAGISGKIRIICNSDIDPEDMQTAAAPQAGVQVSPRQPRRKPFRAISALFDALTDDKLEVRVLPDSAFGLIHGKAGVIRKADGSASAFLGSVNESLSAWKLNYELLWEDDSKETIDWVQEEFDALWNDPRAIDLSKCPFIQQDVGRIIKRQVVEPEEWREDHSSKGADSDAAAAAVETPVYRKEQGLWPHQKYFSKLALEL